MHKMSFTLNNVYNNQYLCRLAPCYIIDITNKTTKLTQSHRLQANYCTVKIRFVYTVFMSTFVCWCVCLYVCVFVCVNIYVYVRVCVFKTHISIRLIE